LPIVRDARDFIDRAADQNTFAYLDLETGRKLSRELMQSNPYVLEDRLLRVPTGVQPPADLVQCWRIDRMNKRERGGYLVCEHCRAIYRTSAYRPLFEDRRARAIGDTLTININEKLNASKTASTNADRKGSTTFSLADITFGGKNILKGGSVKGESDSKFQGGGDSGANNVFTGTISVTVIDVFPNGNLLVSGEKQIGINQGSEFVRLSGVVDPRFILAGRRGMGCIGGMSRCRRTRR